MPFIKIKDHVDVNKPIASDGDSVYTKDVWVEECIVTNWIDLDSAGGDIAHIPFNNLHTAIENSSIDNPKIIRIHFNRTISLDQVGIGCANHVGKSFSNVKINVIGSGDTVRETVDQSTNNTKYTSRNYQFSAELCNAIDIEFHTVDAITITNITIQKVVKTNSNIRIEKPDGTFVFAQGTAQGNFKVSLEEYDGAFITNPLPVTSNIDVDQHYNIKQALNEILNVYGDVVSVQSKKKSLLKFGEVEIQTANTWTTIWYTGQDDAEEIYVNRNLIDSASGSSALDTGIGYSRTIEGHTVGDDVSVSSITQTVGTATVTTGAVHGYVIDQYVNIEGANEAGYNGIRKVLTVPTTTTFTYEVASATASPATGTITTNHLNKSFVTQVVQFNGQTRVALTTPLSRVTRQYTHSQNNSQNSNGEMYVYENTTLTAGKPNDTTKIHLTTPEYSLNKSNNSQKASTSLSSSDYYIPTGYHAGLQEKTANLIVSVKLQYRPVGDGWRDLDDPVVLTSGESKSYQFNPYPAIPKNSDIRLLANASASCKVSGGVDGYLAN